MVIAIFVSTGCTPTRYLGENESLLYDIDLKGVKQNDEEAMAALYQQNPNFRIPFTGIMPYLALYNLGKKFYNPERIERKIQHKQAAFDARIAQAGSDSSRVRRLRERREQRIEHLNLRKEEGNLLMRRWGEPPAIYDSAATLATVDQLSIYLDARGFFYNDVSYSKEVKNKKIYLTYQVEEDEPFRYAALTYDIPDTAVLGLVQAAKPASLLKLNDRYDEEVLTRERNRLELLLRNQGYYEFSKGFITFEPDTSYAPYTVRLATLIANPSDTTGHTAYSIRDVYFIGDAGLNRFGLTRDTIIFNKVHFLAYQHRFSPRILNKKITVHPGQLYSQDRMIQTQRRLADLDMFQYTNVSYTKVADSLAQPQLNALVQVSPAPRFQETAEFGINLIEWLPGPFINLRFQVRNLFRGAELLELGVRGGFEGQFSRVESRPVYTREFGGNVAFILPRFLIPIVRDAYMARFNPKTRIISGYTYINRPEYTRTNLETSLNYLWQKRQLVQYIVSPFDVSIVNTPVISADFDSLLTSIENQGTPLRQSFNRSFISSISLSRTYNDNNINQTLKASFLRTYLELGGVSQMFVDYSVGNLEKFQYVKANIDYRRYLPQGNRTMLAYRANVGYAAPLRMLKANSVVLPYDKYFFSGGGASIRAWRPRRLGPGSYAPRRAEGNGEPAGGRVFDPEQPGEILLELSAEYRFPLFSFFNGALFLDAGNIWTNNEDKTRPGAKFERDFYKQIAVGTGFGLRLDFSFLILRLDIGKKVYDPAEPKGERFVLTKFKPERIPGYTRDHQTAYNIGIGYPF